ncbi:alpha-2-macroglobulin receptor-associated protein isoform X1 [Bicyclus anynana]|uniref:Alpha-2-macroglobulin receptor-associated protein isoform X1 n=1 Tax=Bicyclus anynana TaxID=110368 RepID=A0A6J1NMJ1_BICAN|nr:alpha-2-macroglobulin receptor-associated protein isoform X1 [Bicyclus anynana]
MAFYQLLRLVTIIYLINNVLSENKYSRTANEQEKSEIDFRTLEKPFRMNKLNLVWVKAQQRLTEPKLKSLYSDLMIQDKAEIIYKRVKSEGGDKEGLREADLRRKLSTIMTNYGLREHFEDTSKGKQKQDQAFNEAMDSYINKSLFKDKKLNMLWAKAEASGFTSEELAALREEFMHHQDKIDQYYDLLVNMEAGEKDGYKNTVNEEELVKFNEIHQDETDVDKDFLSSANLVREKHRDLRDGYDRLQRISARGPANKEFIEPKVQGLWKMAAASNFTVDELESLKVELKHYESRLLKLRMLHADHVSMHEKHRGKLSAAGDKMDYFADQQQMIKKHTRKVEKLHADLEGRIMARHTEL